MPLKNIQGFFVTFMKNKNADQVFLVAIVEKLPSCEEVIVDTLFIADPLTEFLDLIQYLNIHYVRRLDQWSMTTDNPCFFRIIPQKLMGIVKQRKVVKPHYRRMYVSCPPETFIQGNNQNGTEC